MSKHKTMTLRIDEARAGDLARLLGHVGGGTKSKAIWWAIREYPALADESRRNAADGNQRETARALEAQVLALRITHNERLAELVDLRCEANSRADELAKLRTWANNAADLMRGISEGERKFFSFPGTGSDDIEKLRSLLTSFDFDIPAWREQSRARGGATLSG